MNHFFIYARKSTDEANRQVLSIESQINELKELALKDKLNVIEILQESQTAKEPGRSVFNSMLDRIEKGEAQGILAWHPDRLARNSVDGGRIIHLVDSGKLLFLKFPIFWFEPTPQGKFMLNIAFGQSKYYVDNLAENVKRGLRAKARKGVWPSLAPFGYINNLETKTIIPDPDKAIFVKKVFELYATGEYSLEELAEKVNSLGLLPKYHTSKSTKRISASNIQYLLKNPVYYGLVRWQGEDHEGTHEPIISKELFDRAQKIMKERGVIRKNKSIKDYIFRGIFKCSECGATITAETQKGHNYYRCTRKRGVCFQSYIREELLMQQVKEAVEKFSLSEDWTDKMLEKIEKDKAELTQSSVRSAQELRNQISEIDALIDKLVDIYLAGDLEKETYQKKRSELVSRKMDLKKNLEELGRNGNNRLEPLINFVKWSKEQNKHVFGGNGRALARSLNLAGSNLQIFNKKISFSVEPPFSFLAQKEKYQNWLPR